MTQEKIAQYFDNLTAITTDFSKDVDMNFTGALVEILEDINDGSVHVDANKPNSVIVEQIQTLTQSLRQDKLSADDLRKLLQLVTLKVHREDKVPANSQITPDGIGYLLSDFLLQTAALKTGDTLIDFNVGTGNLLNTVNNLLVDNGITVVRIGIDNDSRQLALASAVDGLINDRTTSFYEADVVQLEDTPKAKVVIADLPVGYYPMAAPSYYATQLANGQSMVHQLLIEKSLDFLTPDGWAYLLVPADVLSGTDSKKLLGMLTAKAQIKAFLQLPNNFFQNQSAAKAILVIRKKQAENTGDILMGQYPPLKDVDNLKKFLQDIKAWVKLDREKNEA